MQTVIFYILLHLHSEIMFSTNIICINNNGFITSLLITVSFLKEPRRKYFYVILHHILRGGCHSYVLYGNEIFFSQFKWVMNSIKLHNQFFCEVYFFYEKIITRKRCVCLSDTWRLIPFYNNNSNTSEVYKIIFAFQS